VPGTDVRRLFRGTREVKVHGLLRTGTNYIAALLQENFRVRALGPDEGGWKHGPIQVGSSAIVVVTFKSPYTWLTSFYDWERIHERTRATTLLEFASAPVTHPRLAEVWAPTDPLDAWNRTTTNWLHDAGQRNFLIVRYEDMISDVAAELGRFESFSSARRRHEVIADIEQRVDTWPTPNPRGPLDRSRYRAGNGSGVEADVRTLMDQRLDPALLTSLGYRDAR
jgi:hypothetical protein